MEPKAYDQNCTENIYPIISDSNYRWGFPDSRQMRASVFKLNIMCLF